MAWIAILTLALLAPPAELPTPEGPPVSLRGSPAAMQQQHEVALQHGLSFFRTQEEIREAVARGELVELHGSDVYEVAGFVDLPYLHPAARLFVTRTAAQYHEACGQPLVVTSGVRAAERQPRNAHALSVHPAGIAVDLRVSTEAQCREWLEAKLLTLEEEGVVNGIREFRPPHYHVAVFPAQYLAYVAARTVDEAVPVPTLEEESAGRDLLVWFLFIGIVALLALGTALLARRRTRTLPRAG